MKIVFTGPECTGKTSIAQIIGQRYDFYFIPEMARAYLDLRHNTYNEQSLYEIALLQLWKKKPVWKTIIPFVVTQTYSPF